MADSDTPASKSGADAAIEAARVAAEAGTRQAKESARAAEAVAAKTAEAGRAAAKANSDILRSQMETAEQAVRSGLEASVRSFEGMSQNWTRALGAAAPNPDLAEKSAQNVQVVSQASTVLAKGAQDASRAWLELTQRAMRTNLEALSQLAACRTMQEVVTLQSNLLRDNLQQAIESGEIIARVSSDTIREATRAMQPGA
ncbi:phasin family protein [Phenylobacterium sp. LjRoot219]|uniref:phasin family protein n=1 Tax=Phenylobacterium sp. LjRoot219 TaxID=3342283 RepID=UPI003ECDC9DD